jgi:protein-tyrosine phosphatase
MGGIIHVCTANQIRSPIAERLMRASLWRRHGQVADSIYLMSGGTQARGGLPMQPLAAAELYRRAVPSDDFVSRPLDLDAAARAHLVLTATREHRDEIVALAPAALHHTFTWRELAWLVRGTMPNEVPGRYLVERVSNLARVARRRRSYLKAPAAHRFDVADPMGGTKQDYIVAATQIEKAIEAILDAV